MRLSDENLNAICRFVDKGARIVVGRDAAGMRKIKVYRWPLGLFPLRWKCTEEDFNALRVRLLHLKDRREPPVLKK